jgi:hypothetical protein
MPSPSFTWLAIAIAHAHRVFNHATDSLAQQRAEWEVQVLEEWGHQSVETAGQLVKENIQPLIQRLRRRFEGANSVKECSLIEWQLARLATWENHLNTPTPGCHPRLRF